MTFLVEDGTGLPEATSFISVEYADAYFADRGNETWADLDEAAKESALIQATDYIMLRFGESLAGNIGLETQALLFPRIYISGVLSMPLVLKKATAEYALRASKAPLAPDLVYDDSGRLFIKKREEVGPIVEETSYATITGSTPKQFNDYPLADGLMSSLLLSRNGGLVRA